MKDFRSVISDYLNKNDRHKKQLAAVVSLSMLVSFTVPMILQEPASSMTGDSFTPVGDILSTKLFNAQGNMVSNLNDGQDGNDGYSKGTLTQGELLIGRGSELYADSATDVIANARKKYFLGIASDFCIFLEGNFTPKAADAEGRVAVGGNIIAPDDYQIGAGDFGNGKVLDQTTNYKGITDFAHIIMSGNTLNGAAPYGTYDRGTKMIAAHGTEEEKAQNAFKRFVVPANFNLSDTKHKADSGNNAYNNNCTHWGGTQFGNGATLDEKSQFYNTDNIINFSDEFSYIRGQSEKLSKIKGIEAQIDGNTVIFDAGESCTDKVVYFTIDADQLGNFDGKKFEFKNIPEFDGIVKSEVDPNKEYNNEKVQTEFPEIANIVINVKGTDIKIGDGSSNIVETEINGIKISNLMFKGSEWSNNHPYSENILYNFYEANNIYVSTNFNGTILAPNADAKSAGNCEGHLSGSLIAQSFEGGLEFGYRPYRGTVDILPSSSGYGVPIKKIKPNGDALAGATFGIFKQDSDTPETTFKSDENGNGYVNIPSQVDFSGDTTYTDANNTITNTYVIKETEAPAGFVKDDNTTYQITVTETIDINSMHENADGTKIPAKVLTQVTSTDESFTIELEDIYDEISGDRIKRELTIGDEIYVIEIDKGDATNVYKRNKESKSTEVTVLSSSGTHFTTNITTHGASTVYDENGNAVTTNVTTERIAKDFDYNISQIICTNADSNISGKLTLYYKDKEPEEITINKDLFNWNTGDNESYNQWWGQHNIQKENVIGFNITINSVDEDCELIFKGSSDNGDFDWENELVKYQIKKTDTENENGYNKIFGRQTIPTEDAELYEDKIITYDVVTTMADFNIEVNTYLTETWTKNIGIYDTETITAFTDGYKSPTTFTTVVEEEEYEYKYDPETLMIMPQPLNTPTFTNDYGLMFSKWGVSNDVFVEFLPNAIINIEDTNGTKVKENILNGTNGSVTINLSDLKENTVYKFVEPDAPNDYEKADPIFFTIDGTIVKYGNDDKCEDGTFDLTANGTDNAQSIVMKDTKISGAEIKLSKWNAELTESLSGAEFQLYADTGEGLLIYPLGDNETFTINDTFNLHDTLKNADSTTYNTEYIKDGYLKEGRYYLREVNAPTGYTAQDKFKFKVNSDNTIEMVESGVPAYISTELDKLSTDGGNKQVFVYPINSNCNRISVSNVTKIEVELNSPSSGTLIVYESNSFDNTKANIENSVATFDNLNNISFEKFKLQNDTYANGLDIKEVRIYGEEGKGSGGSSGGGSNYPDGVTVSNDKKTIEIKGNTLSKAKSKPNEKFITIEFNSTGAGGQIKYNGGQYVGNNLGNDGLSQIISYSLNEVYDILKNSSANLNSIDDISDLTFAVWNGGDPKNITFPLETAEAETTTTSDTSSGESTETTPAVLNVTVEEDMIKIPNGKQGDKTTISVEKKWADSVERFPELKPASIQVKLNRYKDDGTTLDNPTTDFEVKTLNEANGWKASWTDLDSKYTDSDGTEKYYKYMVVEETTNLQNYKVPTYSPNVPTANGTIEITNTPETIEITAEKIWLDSADNAITDSSLLPTEIQVKLQYKGENTDWTDVTDGTYTLTSADDWKKTISDLPAVYEYKIVELNVPNGWEVHETADTAKKGDLNASITNKQQVGSLEINKEWKGDTASDRPNSINIELYRSTQSPVSGSSTIENIPTTNQYENYAKALQYSLYFYDANMCGSQVNETSAYSWRKNCHTYNNVDGYVDGGFHDAGDHLMLGLPQGFAASTLGWSYYEFKDSFDSLGQTEHYKTIMKYFCDFFNNSVKYDNDNVLSILVQKGSESGNQRDHSYWGTPEQQPQNEYGVMYWKSPSEASNVAMEYAAALAAYAVNFPEDVNSASYLNTAKKLYNSAKDATGCWEAEGLYPDSESNSEKAWAAAWLYLATKDNDPTSANKYKEDCKSKLENASIVDRGHFWGDTTLGAATIYATQIDPSNDTIKNKVTGFLNKCQGTDFVVFDNVSGNWGSIRHNALAQTVALIYDKYQETPSYTNWCAGQMAYILGKNTVNQSTCFITGFATNSAKNLHHKAATGTKLSDNDWKAWSDWDGEYSSLTDSNTHTIIGALSGGNGNNTNYKDNCKEHEGNEVALDYNAGLVGAAAGLYYHTGKGTLDTAEQLKTASGNELRKVYDETPVNVKNYETIEVTQATGESKDNGILNIGDEKKLVLANSDNKNVTWSIENPDDLTVATIEKGILTAVEDGTATIKATVNGAVVAEYALTVQIASINTGYISADNGYQLVKSITINADDNDNNWNITETDLPLYDANGRKYYYYIKEKDVQKYYAISYTNGVSLDNDTNSVSVTNKKYDNGGVTMPSSGGTGTRNYYVVGTCMIGIAGIFLIRRRKKVTE